jgi:hypothetical protein
MVAGFMVHAGPDFSSGIDGSSAGLKCRPARRQKSKSSMFSLVNTNGFPSRI